MGKTKALIRKAYNEHFDGLREIADEVDALNCIVNSAPDSETKAELKKHLEKVKQELIQHTKNLQSRGVELFENAA